MSFPESMLVWSVPVAIALHNLEEAIWLPGWSAEKTGRWRRPVGAWEFRFAVVILTLVVFALGVLTQVYGGSSPWHYLLAAFALGQALNIFVPHLAATIATRSYAPGLLTGVLLVLPSAALLLYTSFSQNQLQPGRFLLIAALFIPAMLLSLPILFWLGGRLHEKSV